jgi:hypothetical protein
MTIDTKNLRTAILQIIRKAGGSSLGIKDYQGKSMGGVVSLLAIESDISPTSLAGLKIQSLGFDCDTGEGRCPFNHDLPRQIYYWNDAARPMPKSIGILDKTILVFHGRDDRSQGLERAVNIIDDMLFYSDPDPQMRQTLRNLMARWECQLSEWDTFEKGNL